jgi:hypothetical protein
MNVKIANSKIHLVLSSIEKIDTKHLDASEIINLISIKKELQKAFEVIGESQEKILKEYDLKSVEGTYSWIGHEKSSEINERIGGLLKEEYELSVEPKVSELNFYESVKGMKLNEIEELSNVLLK